MLLAALAQDKVDTAVGPGTAQFLDLKAFIPETFANEDFELTPAHFAEDVCRLRRGDVAGKFFPAMATPCRHGRAGEAHEWKQELAGRCKCVVDA